MRVADRVMSMDVLVALVLAAGAQLEIWAPRLVPGVGQVVGDRPILAATALTATVPLAFRQRIPLLVLFVVVGSLTLQQRLTTPTQGLVLLIAGMMAAYASSAYTSTAGAGVAGGVIVLGAALIGSNAADWAFIAVVLGAAWLFGFIVAQRSTELTRAQHDNRDLRQRLADASAQLIEAQRNQAISPA